MRIKLCSNIDWCILLKTNKLLLTCYIVIDYVHNHINIFIYLKYISWYDWLAIESKAIYKGRLRLKLNIVIQSLKLVIF